MLSISAPRFPQGWRRAVPYCSLFPSLARVYAIPSRCFHASHPRRSEERKSESTSKYKPSLWVTLPGGLLLYFLTTEYKKWKEPEKHDIHPALTLHQANSKLFEEQFEKSSRSDNPYGQVQFHGNRVPSNNPVEDDHTYGPIKGRDGGYDVWGVFDGHVGWATSATLRKRLVPWLGEAISKLEDSTKDTHSSPNFAAGMVACIKDAFIALDQDLLNSSLEALQIASGKSSNALAEALHLQAPYYAGSCAIVCLYDRPASRLYTACVGDSRAVLVRQGENGQYTAVTLSEDQTGFNTSEAKRVREAHPGEHDCIDDNSGRLLGIAVTRAFGDGLWKWSIETIETMREQLFGHSPRPGYKTPPYLTAEPEVTITDVRSGDVVVMASDGLWDHMSNDTAAECIGQWLAKYRKGDSPSSPEESTRAYTFTGRHPEWKAESEFVVTEDKNAATHLIRNALGGNRRDLFTGVMSALAPFSREARDDVTVQVIFF